MIRAVVFDFGGVMTTSTMPQRVMEAVARFGIPWKAVADGFAVHRLGYDQGVLSLEEMYRRIWADAKITVTPEQQAVISAADTASWLYRNERTLTWIRALRARGYRIGILTNMAPTFAPLFREHFADFIAESSAMVISGEVNLVKPMPEIYELLRSRIGLPAGELLFVDDLAKNCDAARRCGWQALQFVSNDQAEKDFERLSDVP